MRSARPAIWYSRSFLRGEPAFAGQAYGPSTPPAEIYVFDVYSNVRSSYEILRFVAEAAKLWSTEEWLEFFQWIAGEPDAGAVIKDSGGCRKVRWSRPGTGKSSGVRVIYFKGLAAGELCMLLVYPKSARDAIPGHVLRMIRKELEDGIDEEG